MTTQWYFVKVTAEGEGEEKNKTKAYSQEKGRRF